MSTYSMSPSVVVIENDETLYPQEVSGAIAALAGVAQWGPVDQATLVTGGESDFVQRFHTPDEETFSTFFSGAVFMSYAPALYFTRVVGPNARNAVPSGMAPLVVKNDDAYESTNLVGYPFIAKYPGALGNGLTVSVADNVRFPTWEFRNQFDYAPQNGEFAVAVVDGSGAFTGAGAAAQVERLSISGSASGGVRQKQTVAITGTAAGGVKQQERLTIQGTATATSLSIGGVSVTLVVGDSQNEIAAKIATALAANAGYDAAYSAANVVYLTYATFGPKTPLANLSTAGLVITSSVALQGNANFSVSLYGKAVNLVNGQTAAQSKDRIQAAFANDPRRFQSVATVSATSFTFEYVEFGPQTTQASQVIGGLTFATTVSTPGNDTATINVFGLTVSVKNRDSASAVAVLVAKALNDNLGAQGLGSAVADRSTVTYTYPRVGAQTRKQTPVAQLGMDFDVTVAVPGRIGTLLERFELVKDVAGAKNHDGTTAYVVDVINQRSRFVWYGDRGEILNSGDVVMGGGVSDQRADATAAYEEYANTEEYDVNYFIHDGNITTSGQKRLIDVAEKRRDAFAFVSPMMDDVVNNKANALRDVLEWRNTEVNRESSYAFNDSNWARVYDKYNDKFRWIPCSSGTAGLKARATLGGSAWSPFAGHEFGRYKIYDKLAWNPRQEDSDALDKVSINSVASFKGEGFLLYGDKTSLSRPSAFQQVNVRSAFIVAQKTLANFARYFLFKNNSTLTRAQFENACRPFLRNMQAREAFEEVKFKSDAQNNPAEVRQARQLVGTIWAKPMNSVNRVILNFNAVSNTTSFEELEERLNT